VENECPELVEGEEFAEFGFSEDSSNFDGEVLGACGDIGFTLGEGDGSNLLGVSGLVDVGDGVECAGVVHSVEGVWGPRGCRGVECIEVFRFGEGVGHGKADPRGRGIPKFSRGGVFNLEGEEQKQYPNSHNFYDYIEFTGILQIWARE
jgi:hypothetical protein